MSLTGFGLVTQQNAPFYVPFNSSEPFLSNSTLGNSTFGNSTGNATYGVTDEQRQEAYTKWINATIETGVSGAIHYQVREVVNWWLTCAEDAHSGVNLT